MTQTTLKSRINDTLYKKRRRHFYTRWWGVALIIGCFLVVAYGAIFIFQLAFHYGNITSGEYINRAVDDIKQQATVDLLHNAGDPSIGPKDAKVVIVAFEDFQCPYCLAAQPMIKRILAQYGSSVRFIFKDFPLTVLHPEAEIAAEAAACANEQGKFWEYHDKLFENQGRIAEAYLRIAAKEVGLNITQYNECVATGKYRKNIGQDIDLGETLGVVGTPTFFVNGVMFRQGYPVDRPDEEYGVFVKAIEYIMGL